MDCEIIGCEVELAGEHWQLLAERGLWWPARETLFVADTHFGKDASFRHAGIPVPSGGTFGTLKRIGRMLDQTRSRRLVILGDMFHSRTSLCRQTRDAMEEFFTDHPSCDIGLVPGNHDRGVGPLPADWPIELLPVGTQMGSVALIHDPSDRDDGALLNLCGHVHPAVRLNGSSDRMGKLPCFWLSHRTLVLPAIGDFTGTHAVRPREHERVWVVSEADVHELHAAATR